MKLLIVAGMPAAGKSTIAKKIGAALGFPILEKDEVKEELFDTLGYADRTEKRRLDLASNAVLMRNAEGLLKSGCNLILVNNFPKAMEETVQKMIDRCGCKCAMVFLGGDNDVFYHRYVKRDQMHLRHIGHSFIHRYPPQPGDDLNISMTREDFAEIFEKNGMAEFQLNGPRIDVDATYPEKIDVENLIDEICRALED